MFSLQLDVVAFSLQDSGFYRKFRKCGEKSKLAEHAPIFANKTAGRKSPKPWSGRHASGFHSTSEFRTRLVEMFIDCGCGI